MLSLWSFSYLFSFDDGDRSRTLAHDDIRVRQEHFDDSVTSEEPESEDEPDEATEDIELESIEEQDDDDATNVYLSQLDALNQFCESLLKNYEYFLYGEDTSQCEAFHFVCNCHYVKGTACGFDQYKMRKTHAAFHWMESQQDKFDNVPLSFPQRWEKELISQFKLAIVNSYSPNAKKSNITNTNTNTNS